MALKAKKKVEEAELHEVTVEADEPMTGVELPEEVEAQLNSDEKEALTAQHDAEVAKSKEISLDKMQAVVALVQKTFNLAEGNYVVNAFSDKGTKSSISLTNEDFDISITIKDNEKFNIM